ncbi:MULTISPECIES: toll/interleukin-1 receptor domain-containing protein [Planktothricoides]|uniref:TIR domain-containing protein n=1 Tax=Planktothricoides raciborskii FACHB-1370 TaxID=2949576 RepID=A0ABR8E6R4_9CYAN|nr:MULTISPECIES: TIR domain-containing protein [Planktothricoides]MBD2542331.1 TIR domain-containing protein [Planktothricoides raciborskii FACHB-1370]MBD2581999.1 TIR domain-containing protein [Planktothricoides raciborskii FACHB-1261]
MAEFYDAFISYGRADSQEFAIKLYNCLTNAGFNIWFDQHDIPLAVDFQNQIDDGIAKADNFLFIISPHSVNSPYCQKEINLALKYHKRIIPLLHVEQITQEIWQRRNPQGTEAEWQDYQAKGLHSSFTNIPPEIAKINWVYFRENIDNINAALAGLIDLFYKHQDYVRQHTELLAKALEWAENKKPNRYLLVAEERQKAEDWLEIRFKGEQAPCQPTDLHCEFICESIKDANNFLTQVFIRYAEEDRGTMEKLTRTLQREKITIWTERSDIRKRMSFQEKLNRGILVSDNFVYLVSADSLQSDYCQKEINLALSYHKRVICFMVPSPEMEALPEFSYEHQANELIKQIRDDDKYYEYHKILLVQSLKWQEQNRHPSILFRGYKLQNFQAWLKVAETRLDHPPTALQQEFIAASSQYQAKSLEVFICYSRTDSDLARKINDALQSQGKLTWFDQESIAAGIDFQQEIYRGIEISDNFLFIISPSSVNSPYCAAEVEYAQKLNKRFVTILYNYHNLDPETLPPALAKIQWIDFNQPCDFYANFSELIRTIDTDREYLRSHTLWLQKASEWQEKGKNSDLLLRGSELTFAEVWLQESEANQRQPPPTALQKEYIGKSHRQKLHNRLWQIGILATFVTTVSGAAVFAGFQWQKAERQATIMGLRESALLANNLLSIKPLKALIWAIEITGESEAKLGQVLPQVQSSLSAAIAFAREQNQFRHESWVRSVAFSPDGKKIISSSSDRTVKIWDIQGNLLAVLNGHTHAVTSVAVSPDGQKVVSGSDDKTIRIWDISGQERGQFFGHKDIVTAVAFAPDGKTIASGSLDRTIRIWDVFGQPLGLLKGHEDIVTAVAFSPDGKMIISGSRDHTIRLWHISGQPLRVNNRVFKGHEADVTAVAVSSDGQRIVSAGADRTIRVWDISGNPLAVWNLGEIFALSLAIAPDDRKILAGNSDKTIGIWDMSGNEIAVLKGHQDSVWSVAFSPNGQTVVSGSRDKTVRLWDSFGNQVAAVSAHNAAVRSVAIAPNGQTMVSGGEDTKIQLWDISGRKLATLQGHQDAVRSVAFSPDGQTIVSASEDKTVRLWNLQGQELAVFRGHEAPVYSVAFSPDGQTIVSASEDKTLRLWNRQGEQKAVFSGHKDYVRSVAFSPDGQTIVSGSYDKTVRLWDLQGNQLKLFSAHQASVYAVAFSPDGQTIVSGGEDDTLRLWNRQGEHKIFQGHDDAVISLAFSPDGQTIVSGSYDHTVRLWDLSGNQLAVITGHEAPVYSVAMTPDGQKVISGSSDKTIRVWQGSWQSWLLAGCERLRSHPALIQAEELSDAIAFQARKTCQQWQQKTHAPQRRKGHKED